MEIEGAERQAAKLPCARCGAKQVEVVISFLPDSPELFGVEPGRVISCALCLECFDNGNVDIGFLESHLQFCGVAVNARQQ